MAPGGVCRRVGQQVVDHLAQARGVANDVDGSLEFSLQWTLGIDDPCSLDGGFDDAVDRDRSFGERRFVVEACEEQEVIDQLRHARGLVLDRAHRVGEVLGAVIGVASEQLRVAADRRQGRAQLVRGVGKKTAQAALRRVALRECGLDLVKHSVQRGRRATSSSIANGLVR